MTSVVPINPIKIGGLSPCKGRLADHGRFVITLKPRTNAGLFVYM